MLGPVVVYGSICWDEIYQLPHYPELHEKVRATGFHDSLGGSGANSATWLASRVQQVEFLGAVGDDTEGAMCIAALSLAGVGTSHIRVCAREPTARAASWVADGQKRIVSYRGAALWLDHADERALALSASASHFHIASHVDHAGLECLRAAAAAGVSTSVELSGYRHDEVRQVADIVFVNADELRTVFGLDATRLDPDGVRLLAPKDGALLVVTAGASAVICGSRSGVQQFPVIPAAKIVDRTGAGDAFDGGFLAVWTAGGQIAEAVAMGQSWSREALGQLGAARNG